MKNHMSRRLLQRVALPFLFVGIASAQEIEVLNKVPHGLRPKRDRFAIVRQSAPLAVGTQDFTHPTIIPFKAAIFIVSGATSDASAVLHARVCVGFCDYHGNERCSGAYAKNGESDETECGTPHSSTAVLLLTEPQSPPGTVVARAEFDSVLSNGVRVNWTVAPDQNYLVTCILFGGDCDAIVGKDEIVGSTATVTTGLDADFYVLTSPGTANPSSIDPDWDTMTGFVARTGSGLTQASQAFRFVRLLNPTADYAYVRPDRALTHLKRSGTATVTSESAQVTEITSTGFQLVADGTAGIGFSYLGIDFADDREVEVVVEDLPTSTGQTSFTGLGFRPKLVLTASSLIPAATPEQMVFDGTAGSSGLSAFTASSSSAYSFHHQDGVLLFPPPPNPGGFTSAGCAVFDEGLALFAHDGATAKQGTLASMLSTGFMLDFSVANSSPGRMIVLGIQDKVQ